MTDETQIWDVEWFTCKDYQTIPCWDTVSEWYYDKASIGWVIYNNTPILNQWSEWACTVFWITKAENEADHFDEGKILDAMKLWKDAIAEWKVPSQWKNWWSMSWALNFMKNKGYISWWYFVNTPESIWKALEAWHMCYTWTRLCSWAKTKKSGKFTKSDMPWTGHAFAVIWINYDDEVLIAANSWGEQRWVKNWLFEIGFEDMNNLYSVVAIMDKVVTEEEKWIAKDMEDSKLMADKWVWNWIWPNNNLEKIHWVYMVMRAFVDNTISNDKALEMAQEKWIVTNYTTQLTRRHFLYMVFRAAYGNTRYEEKIPWIMQQLWIIKTLNNLDEPITRYHASLVIARMMRNLWVIE